jgi:hypothetical protein
MRGCRFAYVSPPDDAAAQSLQDGGHLRPHDLLETVDAGITDQRVLDMFQRCVRHGDDRHAERSGLSGRLVAPKTVCRVFDATLEVLVGPKFVRPVGEVPPDLLQDDGI